MLRQYRGLPSGASGTGAAGTAYGVVLAAIVRRDLAVRYKQATLGFAWAIFVPLASMLVFTVVFTQVVRVETDLPYPVYAYAGLLPWTFFAASLQTATTSLTGNIPLITKVYLPREIFPISAVLVAFVDFLLASAVLGGLMAWYGIRPAWTVLLVPLVLAVQVALTVGLALLLAVGNLFFRAVRYLSGVGLTLWMFASSVLYPVEQAEGRLGAFLELNPMTPVLNAYRSLLLHGELPTAGPLVIAAAISLVVLIASWKVFRGVEGRLAERI
jgi:ABC-type polysaccharide/polyol phosphate export permease